MEQTTNFDQVEHHRYHTWNGFSISMGEFLLRNGDFTQFYVYSWFIKGWQTSRGHNRWLLVDKRGDISWALLVTSGGQKCQREVLFLGEFSWTFLGEFLWKFWVNFSGHLIVIIRVHKKSPKSVHEKSHILKKKVSTRRYCPQNVSIHP